MINKQTLIFKILIAFLCLEALYFFAIAPRMPIAKVILKNDLGLSDEQILDLIELNNGSNYFSFNHKKIEAKIKNTISLEKIEIKKYWPGTVKVVLEGFGSIGRLKNSNGDIIYINSQGLLFSQSNHTDKSNPWIAGLNIENNKLSDSHKKILEDIMFLKKSNLELFSFIESLEIVDNDNKNDWYYIVKFKDLNSKILWASRLSEQKLYNSLVVANLLKDINLLNKKLIDFRTDEIVYK